MALVEVIIMENYEYLYSMGNLTLAWRKARKNKTLHEDVIEFEKGLMKNLIALHYELKNKTYKPKQLTTFVLRDPKQELYQSRILEIELFIMQLF